MQKVAHRAKALSKWTLSLAVTESLKPLEVSKAKWMAYVNMSASPVCIWLDLGCRSTQKNQCQVTNVRRGTNTVTLSWGESQGLLPGWIMSQPSCMVGIPQHLYIHNSCPSLTGHTRHIISQGHQQRGHWRCVDGAQ